MPGSQLTGPTTDAWWNAGSKYIRSGATRGTTTSTGVFTVNTGFLRNVIFAFADQEASGFRRADQATLGGTQGTYFNFQFLSTDSTIGNSVARFRVRKITLSAGGTQSSYTLATSTSGVTARWAAFGF